MPQKPKRSSSKEKGFKLKAVPEETPAAPADPQTTRSFEDLGELPHGYGVDTIFLIAQEPHWLFTYWDIDISRHPGGAACLRYTTGDGEIEGEIEVPFETRNWYIPVKKAACEYWVELGFYRGKTWNMIARSMTVTTPPEGMAASEDFDYATVPFHLSFQRLMDHLESASRSGEDLLATAARLQQNGDFLSSAGLGFPDLLNAEQRALLSALMGPELLAELASGNLSSERELEAKIRAFLEEQLSSGGASEALSSFGQNSALFSGMLASWLAATAGSSETSWTAGESTASWNSLASWAQAALASWGGAASASWSQAVGSSWAAGAESSGALASMSSWLQGVQSSWAQAALASWNSAEVSSWFSSAATTSWSGASETLSSFGRSFYMHVNAEVIFYGGTDPRAKVTIGGKPITLGSDGSFRYHFVFPNADYEIPIVATSPDGVETRSATLKFSRSTGKVGIVTDTPQPPLGEPMGRQGA